MGPFDSWLFLFIASLNYFLKEDEHIKCFIYFVLPIGLRFRVICQHIKLYLLGNIYVLADIAWYSPMKRCSDTVNLKDRSPSCSFPCIRNKISRHLQPQSAPSKFDSLSKNLQENWRLVINTYILKFMKRKFCWLN